LTIADRIAVLRHGLVVTTGNAKDLHLNEVLGMMLGAEVPAA
jgi:ABC-type sugar transport system ATPase subunit